MVIIELVERAQSMLVNAHLDRNYWVEAVQMANHCKNISPIVAVAGMTSYEKWHGDKPNLKYFSVFGCIYSYSKTEKFKIECKSKRINVYWVLSG